MACVECLSVSLGSVMGVFTLLVLNRAVSEAIVQPKSGDLKKRMKKLLFICSYNINRSVTAEWMYDGVPAYAVRSAGTEEGSRFVLTKEHVQWADIIFVMEPCHLQTLQQRFGEDLAGKKVHCLHIPDIYEFLEPALMAELKTKLKPYVQVPA
jgi:predicted protein tyrosine phosphatase